MEAVFTVDFIVTQAGLFAAVMIVTEGVKTMMTDPSTAVVRWTALVSAIVLAVGGFVLTSPVTVLGVVAVVLNALVVALAAMKSHEVVRHGIGAEVPLL